MQFSLKLRFCITMCINTLFKNSNAFHHHWLQHYHLKQVVKRITYKFSTRIYKNKVSKPLCLKSTELCIYINMCSCTYVNNLALPSCFILINSHDLIYRVNHHFIRNCLIIELLLYRKQWQSYKVINKRYTI